MSITSVATVAEFTSAKEISFKSGLATDLKVNISQIAVTVAASRRHLLAGVTVDYTVSGIEVGRCRLSPDCACIYPRLLQCGPRLVSVLKCKI